MAMKQLIYMIGFFLLLVILFISGCDSMVMNRDFEDNDIFEFSYERPYFESYYSMPLQPGQKKVLNGAKKVLELQAVYDTSMGYHRLSYKHGAGYVGGDVYPGGDLDPGKGVCTDVIIRALRYGGVADLQKEIHEEIKTDGADYPLERWSQSAPNREIDHRRVPNQHTWFKRNWLNLGFYDFQPGDVVIWDLDDDGAGDHIGIVSDRMIAGIKPYIIHNSPDVGYTSEGDVLKIDKMIGHYRIKESDPHLIHNLSS